MDAATTRKGLLAALKGQDVAEFPDKLLYQFQDAKPYNLDYPIIPAAVTYPKTEEQIADIVRYAASVGLKVQARSGGHSYGNYGKLQYTCAITITLLTLDLKESEERTAPSSST
jgi:hypothetical protein